MLAHSQFVLTNSKLSVYAEYHNPSILNERFLSENGIVPHSWPLADASSSWQFSQVRYQNNFSVSLSANALDVEDNRRVPIDGDPTAVEAVSRYLDVVQMVNYRSLAANLVWERPTQNPGLLLTERFLNPGFQNEDFGYLRMDPRFRFAVNGWRVNLWLYSAWLIQPTNEMPESLSINVQATSQAVDSVASARAIVEQWPAVQEVIERVALDLLWRYELGVS